MTVENKKLSVIVPYRNREEHLKQFLPHIKKTLSDQKIDFRIVIAEQEEGKPFNRAKLLNVGFDQSRECDYFCFHDVDMLAIVSDYSYCSNPTHLAAEAEQFGYKLPYNEYFGGVTLFDKESFLKINGYENNYFGWGAEDDSVFKRCKTMQIVTSRKQCRFKSLAHERIIDPIDYRRNISILNNFGTSYDQNGFKEGLSTLSYKVLNEIDLDDKTKKILVSI